MRKIVVFIFGFVLGVAIAGASGLAAYKLLRRVGNPREILLKVMSHLPRLPLPAGRQVIEEFDRPLTAVDGGAFGREGQLTFELYRNGKFLVDGASGQAWQISEGYGDSAIIRSTQALPRGYKIEVVAGQIDYGLEKIKGLPHDPQYKEGPGNENGCYLISIVEEPPTAHYTNLWWHQHRKIVIDVDNNVWGHGMPNPIFFAYFDKKNALVSWDAREKRWGPDWHKAATYDPQRYYRFELERTASAYILSVTEENGSFLARTEVPLSEVRRSDLPEYFVIGDPHENYYAGSMKIKSISISVTGLKGD
jgi:hypothetical protein